ncbi:hypothetical protein Q9966_016738 [Columba livia]|nr:hypothetical protein Q9966_016738 [Columba livia]
MTKWRTRPGGDGGEVPPKKGREGLVRVHPQLRLPRLPPHTRAAPRHRGLRLRAPLRGAARVHPAGHPGNGPCCARPSPAWARRPCSCWPPCSSWNPSPDRCRCW